MTIQDNDNMLVSAAILLQEDGETSLAIQVLLHVVERTPAYAPAHTMLGALYQAVQNPDQAEYAYRRALELDPNNSDSIKGLVYLFASQQRYREAVAYLKKQLTDNPAETNCIDMLLDMLNHLPNSEADAARALRNAWAHGQDPEMGIRYGRFLLDRDPETAKKVFTDVVAISRTPRTLAELALGYTVTGNYTEALAISQEAVEIDPNFDRAWRGLSHCYLHTGDLENALETAERALAINPSGFRNWQAKTEVLLGMEQYEAALTAAQKSIDIILSNPALLQEKEPVLSRLFLHRFVAFVNLDDIEGALRDNAAARQILPKDPRLYVFPAEILTGIGKPEIALDLIDSASDPSMLRILILLRYKLLHLLGRKEEAWKYIRPSLDKNRERRLEILADVGAKLYFNGKILPAISIYYQLHEFQPENARIATNLGYMLIGEGKLAEAEALLKPVADNDTGDYFTPIAQCNLAYLFTLTGDYAQALKLCDAVLKSKFVDEPATLRVPIWTAGSVQPDPLAVPGRQLTLGDAARACAASASMALGHTKQALKYIESITDENSELKGFILSHLKDKTVQ